MYQPYPITQRGPCSKARNPNTEVAESSTHHVKMPEHHRCTHIQPTHIHRGSCNHFPKHCAVTSKNIFEQAMTQTTASHLLYEGLTHPSQSPTQQNRPYPQSVSPPNAHPAQNPHPPPTKPKTSAPTTRDPSLNNGLPPPRPPTPHPLHPHPHNLLFATTRP